MFDRKAVMELSKDDLDEEQAMEAALEVGAEDVVDAGDVWEVRAEASEFKNVLTGLEERGLTPHEAKLAYLPKNTVKLEHDDVAKVLRLVEALEDNDDVGNVWGNFEIDDADLEDEAAAS